MKIENPKQKTNQNNTRLQTSRNSFGIMKNTSKNYPKLNQNEFQHETWWVMIQTPQRTQRNINT